MVMSFSPNNNFPTLHYLIKHIGPAVQPILCHLWTSSSKKVTMKSRRCFGCISCLKCSNIRWKFSLLHYDLIWHFTVIYLSSVFTNSDQIFMFAYYNSAGTISPHLQIFLLLCFVFIFVFDVSQFFFAISLLCHLNILT